MTEVNGLLSLVLLLAFLLFIIGITRASLRALRRNAMATRGPLAVISVLVVTVPASFLTWANSIADSGLLSLKSLFDSIIQTTSTNSLSWLCLGPLTLAVVVSTLSPAPRAWIISNSMRISIAASALAFVAIGFAHLLTLEAGWALPATALILRTPLT